MRPAYVITFILTLAVAGGTLFLPFGASPVSPPESTPRVRRDARVLPASAVKGPEAYSNIMPGDYVGPQVCAECHRKQHSLWLEHPHRCMNQLPNPNSVKGDFDNGLLALSGGEVQFTTEASETLDADGLTYWMTVRKDSERFRRYKVTRTVGSRFMQYYIGVQVVGPEPPEHEIYSEHMLPFAYWFKLGRWLPRKYLDPSGPEQLEQGVPLVEAVDCQPEVRAYTQVCMNCHNTMPYAYRIYRRNFAGFLSGTVSAAIEPLSEALSHSTPVKPTVEDFVQLNRRLDPDKHLITQGISCESCHFGGREHVAHQKKIRFLPASRFTKVTSHDPRHPLTDSRHNPQTVLGICVQCHSGSGEYYPNGASKGNSREAIDMHLGSCATQLRCVDCHEPHTAGEPSGGRDHPSHLNLCIRCHDKYKDPQAKLAHSRHSAASGVSCLDCHMPRYTQGLDEVVRTHRICAPVEEPMARSGSANACNVCHLEKSLRWTLAELKKGWGRNLQPQPDWQSYDSLDTPVGDAWLASEDAALRLVATQSYARSPAGVSKLPSIMAALNDPVAINRVFAGFAACRLTGRQPDALNEVDITAPPAERAAQIRRFFTESP